MSRARRIGGAGPAAARGRRVGAKGLLLYALPVPLLFAGMIALARGLIVPAVALGTGFGLCMLAANLTRRGIQIELAAQRRKIVRRASVVPYKAFGAAVLSAGVFGAAWWGTGFGVVQSLLFAGVAAIGHTLRYGADPRRKLSDAPAVGVTAEEVLDVIDEAEARIESIESVAASFRNTDLRERLHRIADGARTVLDIIEEDPRDLRRARKFLKVYLDGAQQVTAGYARAQALAAGSELALSDNFRRVLETIESVLEEQRSKLLENDLHDLDVKIEVLQLQLEKEGIA
ncbi:MAG: 5-bromo-4-chloroindolyl phosphate hydrolysis family protein [Pseudomonadota bacterium]